MSITKPNLIRRAQQVAQDPADNKSNLLRALEDYDACVDQALRIFEADRPNERVVHYTVLASAFRFVLAGTGTILPAAPSLDRWIDGGSQLSAVYHPYLTTTQNQTPLDANDWRVVREPGLVLLELLSVSPSSGVLRLEFTRPHVVDATDTTRSSILEADVQTVAVLVAATICEATARRYVQNTGTSAFQNETVDRRTQSDIMAARAKDLMKQYGDLVGLSGGDDGVAAAAVVRRFDPITSHGRGFLWPRA